MLENAKIFSEFLVFEKLWELSIILSSAMQSLESKIVTSQLYF